MATLVRRLFVVSGAGGLLLLLLLAACSTRRNTPFRRGYHRLTAHYNYYFNAHDLYRSATKKCARTQSFDYTRPVPFVLMGLPEAAQVCGGDMTAVVDKCAAMVRLHSITAKPDYGDKDLTAKERAFLGRNEYIPWVRKGWVLLGYARLWQADYEEARKALDFAMRQYGDSEEGWCAELALARLEALQGDTLSAATRLQDLSRKPSRPNDSRWGYLLYGTRADILVQGLHYRAALQLADTLLELVPTKADRARCRMALAQLKERNGQLQEALDDYKRVAREAYQYDMVFNARLRQATLEAQLKGGTTERQLYKMLDDEKNAEYADQIYYALAQVSLAHGDTAKALQQLELSAQRSENNPQQKGVSYLRLADHYYHKRNYLQAEGYYDSALRALPESYPGYQQLLQRGHALGGLVGYARTVHREDSLQRMARMPNDARLALIHQHIEKLQEAARQRKLDEEKAAQDREFALQNQYRTGYQQQAQSSSKWYFYSPVAVSMGRADFRLKWGDRKLEDNWRRKNKISALPEDAQDAQGLPVDSTRVTDSTRVEFYLQDVPLTDSARQASNARLVQGYLGMAATYRYQLQAPEAARATYEALAKRFPSSDEGAGALYSAYLLAKAQGLAPEMKRLAEALQRDYPSSGYAKLLRSPEYLAQLQAKLEALSARYEQARLALYAGQREQAYSLALEGQRDAQGSDMAPYFELLIALSQGNAPGSAQQMAMLKNFSVTHPNSPLGAYAANVLLALQRRELRPLVPDSLAEHKRLDTAARPTVLVNYTMDTGAYWVAVAMPAAGKPEEQKFKIIAWSVDYDVNHVVQVEWVALNESTRLFTIRDFSTRQDAQRYATALEKANPFAQPNVVLLVISPGNYEKLLQQQGITQYLEFYQTAYGTSPTGL